MAQNFLAFLGFLRRPDFDGQTLHRTIGDAGGATSWGWTYTTYSAYARLHGLDPSLHRFEKMTPEEFVEPTRVAFWNSIQAEAMPPGADVIWADFHFGSGGATRTLQTVVGATPDGGVGPKTLGNLASAYAPQPVDLLRRMTDARKVYYRMLPDYFAHDECPGFGNGWDRRAEADLALALSLIHN